MMDTAPKIAIVGSGPAGCFAAQFLRKAWAGAEITIFESLPVPYGLARYGVATDHQGTKGITEQFDRLFLHGEVRFAGNVRVGADLPFEILKEHFDVVLLATGLPDDRSLPIHDECEVIGGGAFLKAVNGHPDVDPASLKLGRRIAVIGNGNVALDVVRLLTKPMSLFAGSDVDDARLAMMRGKGPSSVDIFGRSPAELAKFDLPMLREILALPDLRIAATGLDAACPAAEALRTASKRDGGGEIMVTFHFGAEPTALRQARNGVDLSVLRTDPNLPNRFQLDSVISAIGFSQNPAIDAGWIGPTVFRTGWLRSNGQGAIADNRRDAKAAVDAIRFAIDSGNLTTGRGGFSELAPKIRSTVVDFAAWQRIDAHERATAGPDRCRHKITDRGRMIEIAMATRHGGPTHQTL